MSSPQSSASTITPEQEQYVVDLVNRDYLAGARSDAVQMKCKVGRLCNGRCIPQKHKCAPTSGPTAQAEASSKKGLSLGQKVRLGLSAGIVAAYAGTVAHEVHRVNTHNKGVHAHNAEVRRQQQARAAEDKEFEEHLNNNPDKKAEYYNAKTKARSGYGQQGADHIHETFKGNWRKQAGSPDPVAKPVDDWHKTLGVDKKASPEEIKKAYRDLSMKHHPDKGGSAEGFEAINSAYKASKQRKDSLKWQSIEQAYQTAQRHHDRVNSAFWSV